MEFKLKWWLNILLMFLLQQNYTAEAKKYAFLAEDSKLFQDCKNEPGYLGVADMFDLSKLNVEITDVAVHIEGSFTMLWDVHPNARVRLQCEVLKYERGTWQPTVFTIIEQDFCTALFDPREVYYRSWIQFVEQDDWKCITNKGHTYHHKPFDLETVIDVTGQDISGRHKLVLKLDSFDELNEKQPNAVCLEVVGEVVKA